MTKDTPLIEINHKFLISILLLDFIFIMFLYLPAPLNFTTIKQMDFQVALCGLLIVPIWILSSLLPTSIKDILVFWRIKNPLPGSRAFSVHAPADPRVNLKKLQMSIGKLPTNEREQNALWYEMYKKVEFDLSVLSSHKSYLLFRDTAAISLILAFIIPFTMYCFNEECTYIGSSAALFLVQYFVSAIAARNSGNRFVQSVVAVYLCTGSKASRNTPN